ncbi:glutamine synthetase beta-grasp domain-containing protein [Coxiella burnetii]|uniref:glutamine synthetase beta-grasp domain-containing protein n=1 Tax=Coxiella burnetii TaxID=777 RepID=UPI000773641E|nr:glutamine synthetase beta-grasp domain-containing protein [Coxiella burnetii]AML55472.1 glutamine synthetase [Coxiella burnetii]
MFAQVTYIWMDGAQPTQKLRSKVRIVKHPERDITLADFPEWGFDGSSTYQATGKDSDLILQPVHFVKDPILGDGNYLVLCEVMNPDGSPHASNTRARLRQIMANGAAEHEPWIGFEQEYTLFQGVQPLGWPDRGYPAPQGPFYCGIGADEVFGRPLVEEHATACIEAELMIFGTNAEVMPGQWEFQIGYRGADDETPDPLTVSDHLWLARWLLYRIGEDYGITATLQPKPVKGDWNGAGKHTNFSTKLMRAPATGREAIEQAIERLSKRHDAHIAVYGHGLEERLTGKHETAPITQFSSGVGNRGASVRIPSAVASRGCGYLEDRRPGANADPYQVAAILLETICGIQLPKNSGIETTV